MATQLQSARDAHEIAGDASSGGPLRQSRAVSWRVATALVAAAVLVAVLLGQWYLTPSGLFNVAKYSPEWNVSARHVLAGTSTPTRLVGVGALRKVYVFTPEDSHRQIYFVPKSSPDELLYLTRINDSTLLWDQCVYQLQRHWWQLAPLNDETNGCPRGFHYVPGG